MSKYQPLQSYLASQEVRRVRLSFAELEGMLGFRLPPSARKFAPWWANDGGHHVQARAWLDAGWRTEKVDVPGGRVSFVKADHQGAGVEEPSVPFHGSDETIELVWAKLSPAARRIVEDYAREGSSDRGTAVARLLHEAAIARRKARIDAWTPLAPSIRDIDAAATIREDRDAR